MVRIIPVVLAAAGGLAGQALAVGTTCELGQYYCGYNLLNSAANIAVWKPRIDAALAARTITVDGTHEYDSLFFCTSATTLAFDEYCAGTTNFHCQPSSSDSCRNECTLAASTSDCCGL
ncbi:hypothetical protein B0T19DRAFT_22346 [Cercophora scortea]|uniref:Uncharacterized protein n=1 Tax=Cercophora scortea TaxID=314031 RepID=A0AAE0MKK0_9PEZI|nr:hypothetical protein B0T19DRAFT_22346 [Cercophora scortea]